MKLWALAPLGMLMACASVDVPPPIGVQGHSMIYHTDNHTRTVQMMNEAGIGLIRDECLWGMVEREKGVFALPEGWSDRLDESIEAGIETLLILDYFSPHYDNNLAPHTDVGRDAYARYARFMVEQTEGRIKYFEIWNEPNADGFWPPRHNAQDYADLVKVAAPVIREANPDAYIIGGVTSMIDWDFLTEMIEAGVCDHLDAISVHPYITPDWPESRGIFPEMERLRELSAQHRSDGQPLDIWITEFGYPTGGVNSVDEDKQASVTVRTHLLGLARPWLRSTVSYWFGPDGPDATHNEDNFGLVRSDWSRKPSFHAVQTLTRMTEGAEFIREHSLTENTRVLEFVDAEGNEMLAMWAVDGVVPVTVRTESPITLTDRDGATHTLNPRGYSIEVDLTPAPIYITCDERTTVRERTRSPLGFSERPVTITETEYAAALNDPASLIPRLGLEGMPSRARVRVNAEGLQRDRNDLWVTVWVNDNACLKRSVEVVETLAFTLRPRLVDGRPRIEATVQNMAREAASFDLRLTVRAGGEEMALAPIPMQVPARGSQMVEVPPNIPFAFDDIVHVSASARLAPGVVVTGQQQMSFMTSPRVAEPLTIDGDLGDWPQWPVISLDNESFFTNVYKSWAGPADLSARVHTAWDDSFFYVGVEARDQTFADTVEGTAIYKNDGLEIYFDVDHDGDADEEVYSDDDNQLGLFMLNGGAAAYHWSHHDDYADDIPIVINRDPSANCDYIIEAAIPLERLNFTPQAGMMIGFNCGINDDDDPSREHPFGQDLQMMWTGQRNVWRLPQNMGDLFLVDPQAD